MHMEFEINKDVILNQLENSEKLFFKDPNDEITDDFVHFYFKAKSDGKEVIYDVALYTLQMHYNSELYEIAEQAAEKRFPAFKKISAEEEYEGEDPTDFEEEVGLFMAEVIMEMEEEDAIKVREHIDVDHENALGIGLDVGLNVDEINEDCIEQFINDYTTNRIKLDETHFSFQSDNS